MAFFELKCFNLGRRRSWTVIGRLVSSYGALRRGQILMFFEKSWVVFYLCPLKSKYFILYSEVFQVNLRRLPIIKEEILKDFFGESKNLTLDYSCPLSRKPSLFQRTNLYRLSIDLSSSAESQTAEGLTGDGKRFNSIFDELMKVGYNFKCHTTPSLAHFWPILWL